MRPAFRRFAFGQLCGLFFVQFQALAEPMPPVDLVEGCRRGVVVTASYESYRPQPGKQIGYFEPPLATYKITEVLKGDSPGNSLEVLYDFQDGSACEAEQGWKFTEQLLPKIGSSWLLILERHPISKTLSVYRGDTGRLPDTAESRAKLNGCGL